MKRLFIMVEGQTEEEFVNSVIAPYLRSNCEVAQITPIKIATSANAKGGFSKYSHLKNDVLKRIREPGVIVSMFVDFFRIPNNLPNYTICMKEGHVDNKIRCLEEAIKLDIGFPNFIPYIQKHEFEALLFSSNNGFESLYNSLIYNKTQKIIDTFPNPEEINSQPSTAPSKRVLSIMTDYNKVSDGNMIALEVEIEKMLEKCPRFKEWIDLLMSGISGGNEIGSKVL